MDAKLDPNDPFFFDKPGLKELISNFAEGRNNNPLTVAHSNFFKGSPNGTFGRVYTLPPPAGVSLGYTAHLAVGYGLANSILIRSSNGEFIIIDTGSGPEDTNDRIAAFREAGALPAGNGKLPLRALIYTHNHIDHTYGSVEWLNNAILPPCPVENSQSAGIDQVYEARRHCVEIFAQVTVTEGVVDVATRTGNIIDARSVYMYGTLFNSLNNNGTRGNLNCGIGPKEGAGEGAFAPITKSFTTWMDVRIAGLRVWFRYAPSETNDESVQFLPDAENTAEAVAARLRRSMHSSLLNCHSRSPVAFVPPTGPAQLGRGLLMSAEVIQGPSFPNLYSLRGTTFRNPLTWYESVDILRQFDAWAMAPSHGVPLVGDAVVQKLLITFRDAIQHVHDQSLRYFRRGFLPDEVVQLVQLPEQLIDDLADIVSGLPQNEGMDPLDYLRTFYGSVPQSVREIYAGYLGWNEGDPTLFNPLPPVRRAQRYVDTMGGSAEVISKARASYDLGVSSGNKEEFQWASELLSYVLGAGGSKVIVDEARILKASALLQLAQTTSAEVSINQNDWWSLNPNWRNWLVTGAVELMLAVNGSQIPNKPSLGLIAPQVIAGLPPTSWVQHWTWRYNPSNSAPIYGKRFGVSFGPDAAAFSPPAQRFILHATSTVVRFAFAPEIVDNEFDSVDYGINIPNQTAFENVTSADTVSETMTNVFRDSLESLLESGVITRIRGPSNAEVASFFSSEYFDQLNFYSPAVVGRTGPVL